MVARPELLGDLVIREQGGYPVRVRDVARVDDGAEEAETVAIKDGHPAVVLSVRKQSGGNTVAVVDSVRARMDEIKPILPHGYTLQVIRDNSETIRTSVDAVKEHLILGAFFAAAIVLLFLGNLRSTIIASIAIPISIVGTFSLMWVKNFTLNTITLLALALAVGIVIDDAIVVLENIYKVHRREGHEAARSGGARDQRDWSCRLGDDGVAHRGVPAGCVHAGHRRPLLEQLWSDHGIRDRRLAARVIHAHADAVVARWLKETSSTVGFSGRP